MASRKLQHSVLALAMMAAMLLSPALSTVQAAPLAQPMAPATAPTATYNYLVTPAGNITDDGTIPDNACGATGWPNTRYFLVNDHFNVTDLNVRFSADHNSRGQIQVILTSSPDAAGNVIQRTIVATSGDTDNNYDILLDADTGGLLDDGDSDNTADPVDRTVLQTLLNDFENRDARGAWRMDICDNSSGTTGTLVRAELQFTGDPLTFPARVFSQGPAIAETYYIPLPEDKFWGVLGTLFYPGRGAANGDTTEADSCRDYSAQNANPRQPMIGYTGISITQANTIIYYDHWEDTYEAVINYPTQPTTEVWGDGDLTNGRAPGDADDILVAGQLITLNDIKDTTKPEVIDYDGRDKFAATKPVAVSRSLWPNGATTLFAAADEVYPVSEWGSDYLLPVGEATGGLFDYFQYTGVSVMAASDNTTVYIDRDNNGTPEMTCTLNQGETCVWDDKSDNTGPMSVNNVLGNGLLPGSRVYTPDGKKIQVSVLTGDVCAGYETRSYTLHPTSAWSNQYYAPVSSSTSPRTIGTGQGSTQTMPTVVRLYNPGPGSLTVNWTFGTGATGSQSIPANGTHDVTMVNNTGARFYSAAGTKFYAVGTVDANSGTDDDGAAADWGYTLVPVSSMSPYLIVGWAPGADPNIPGATEDSAPIWLTGGHVSTPASTTPFTVCIDEGGDGGSNTDPNTGRTYDRSISLTPFGQALVYDTRTGVYGETGMQLWVCDGSDAVITAAWGEDPDTISTYGKPTMDMGYTIRNLSTWNIQKGAALLNDANGNGLYDEGETVRFTITVNNQGTTIPANTLNVKDTLPAGLTYVPNSTWVVYHDGSPNGHLTDGVNTPLDAGGYNYTLALPPTKSFQVYFDVTIDFGQGNSTLCNQATGSNAAVEQGAEACIRVQPPVRGAIGDYVWFDEDGDGDQDEGEAGIPNVVVNLYDASNNLIATTVTDAHGGYLFPNLLPGQYRVEVDTSTLPAGLHQTYDENDGTGPFATPHSTTVNLSSGAEHMTADFGYNWAPPADTNNPPSGALGAIGDRVWIDVDGDGVQDANEPGLYNATVELYDAGGNPVATTTTDHNGNYIFDNLPAGAYTVKVTPPAGYTQTGDPDNFGAPCGTACDNQTTTPVVLGPGDVFLNADFGYQPPASQNNSIGNKVWFDADADGVGPNGNGAAPGNDNNEYGIPGVTVALILDLDGDGIWDPDEPIIATTVTDANGDYLFSGLPDGNYLVWVNDTDNVLGDKQPTYDADGGSAPSGSGAPIGVPASSVSGISSVLNLGVGDPNPASDMTQDFGYTPVGQTPATGAIGDTVFLDRNGDGNFDPGEGLEGVVVELYDSGGVKIAETVTDENGHYYFGGLPLNQTYEVRVKTSTLPNGGAGLVNHVDPDIPSGDSRSVVTLTTSDPIDLDQDFGYIPSEPNSISGTIWVDSDADGTLEPGEPGRFGGVTVVLYDQDGNVVATTVTDANGNYSFDNLPDGTYTVDVTDDNGVLNGYWKSNGPNVGQNNNSQPDPYTVTVGPGHRTDDTADFGYYVKPGALGNRVWYDANWNGIQDAGEVGIPGVIVTLTIDWPNGDTTVVHTVTDANGYYSFGNLLLDEDYNGAGTYGTEPTYSISVDKNQSALSYYPLVSPIHASGSTQFNDSDDPAGTSAFPVQGQTDTSAGNDNAGIASYDFGFTRSPAAVLLAGFEADAQADHVLVSWETVSEASNAGFNLYRSLTADGEYTLLGFTPSAAPGGAAGAAYSYQDFDVQAGQTYWYRLEDVELGGATTLHAPVSVAFGSPTAVALSGFAGSAATGVAALSALAGLAAAATAAAAAARRRR